jgi:hypothetical protein
VYGSEKISTTPSDVGNFPCLESVPNAPQSMHGQQCYGWCKTDQELHITIGTVVLAEH